MDKKATAAYIIELPTVVFYRGKLPETLVLHECGLETTPVLPDYFTVLNTGKLKLQNAFLAARQYADKHDLKLTVVDISLALDNKHDTQNLTRMDELSTREVVQMRRMSPEMVQHLEERLGVPSGMNADMRQQKIMLGAMTLPETEHVKMFGYPVQVPFSETLLQGASIHKKFWKSIVAAECRLDPEVKIDMTPPPEWRVVSEHTQEATQKPKPEGPTLPGFGS